MHGWPCFCATVDSSHILHYTHNGDCVPFQHHGQLFFKMLPDRTLKFKAGFLTRPSIVAEENITDYWVLICHLQNVPPVLIFFKNNELRSNLDDLLRALSLYFSVCSSFKKISVLLLFQLPTFNHLILHKSTHVAHHHFYSNLHFFIWLFVTLLNFKHGSFVVLFYFLFFMSSSDHFLQSSVLTLLQSWMDY